MPKKYRHLWPELISFANLHVAYRAARRGKRSSPAVATLEMEDELFQLQDELVRGTYVDGAYHHFTLNHHGKRRQVAAAPWVVHHALCAMIEPIWERRFIYDSYACRVGKGTHRAIKQAQRFARRLAFDLKLTNLDRYEHGGRNLAEIGRLLGGWRKSVQPES